MLESLIAGQDMPVQDHSNIIKHDKAALAQYQSLPLNAKIAFTKTRIKNWISNFGFDGVYLSFSGGKDSTVLKHIIEEELGYNIPAVFVNTGLEYPGVRQFATSQKNVVVVRPKMPFPEVLEHYGYPVVSKEQSQYISDVRNTKSDKVRNLRLYGRGDSKSYKISEKWKYLIDAPFKISHKCCTVMKKEPAIRYERESGRKPFIATMTDESSLRLNSWIKYGCNAFNKTRPTSTPMSIWTEQDVLEYIYTRNVPIASDYGEVKIDENGKYYLTGLPRTGCMFCMYGVQHEPHDQNRFIQMKKNYPKQYQYCMDKLGLDMVLNFMQIEH